MDLLNLRIISTFTVFTLIGLHENLADYVVGDQHRQSCPDGWISLHRGCYMFVGKSRLDYSSWNQAAETCKTMDGELIILQSENEKDDIAQHFKLKYKKKKFWVNLAKKDTEWRWGDNSFIQDRLPWRDPRTKNRYPCAAITISRFKGLVLTSDSCSSKKGFICEYHNINPRASTLSVLEEQTSSNSVEGRSSTPSLESKIEGKTKVHAQTTSVATSLDPSTVEDSTTDRINTERSNATSFTYPPTTGRSKSTQRISTTQNIGANTAEKNKESTSQTTVYQSSTDFTKFTQHVSSSKTVRRITPRVTRSTMGLSFSSPFLTSTSDDSGHDDETDTDGVTESQSETTHHFAGIIPITGISKGPTSQFTSAVSNPSTMTTVDVTDDDDDDEMTIEDIIHGIDTDENGPDEPLDKKVGYRRTSPLPKIPWNTTPKRKMFVPNSFGFWLKAMEEYEGCYIPGRRGTVRQMVMTARRLYKDDTDYCPQVTASRLTFPRTEAGETAVVPCRRGTGSATLHCGDDTVCWEDQPDLSRCASPKFKALLEKIKEEQIETLVSPGSENETDVVEQSFNVTSELVTMTEDDDISMEDILVTSEVLTAFTHSSEDRKVKVKDKKAVKKIVRNVIKAGNNLLSKKKKKLWRKMRGGDKIRSASSLMVAMEMATLSMADNIEEPAVIKQVEENIEVEIQVVDVEKLEEEDEDEIVYDSEQSENTFSIPLENLKSTKDGKLDKVVFITHYSMAEFLDGGKDDSEEDDDNDQNGEKDSVSESSNQDESDISSDDQHTFPGNKDQTPVKEVDGDNQKEEQEEEDPAPQIASYILSASIGGGEGHKVKLQKPVTFTMKHTMVVRKDHIRLCSFWDLSQGGSQGFWSQEGCRMKKSNISHTTCECDHMTSFAILIDVHSYETPDVHQAVLRLITIIGCVISCLCLTISWFTFQFCAALQGERNSIHKNLTACLLVSELLFVAGVTHTEPKIICSVVAVFLHFFFLCAFVWMFLEGLHIIFMLVQVFDASKSRLPYYYLVGYGIPALVVGISCAAYFPGYGTEAFCWLTTDRYFIWAFAGPVALILLVNAAFLAYAMTTVCRHSDYVFNTKDRGAGSPIRSWIQGALALEVLLGLTWTFGYFLLNANTLPLAYAFTILNSLQGMFIFIFHCVLNKKAQKEYSRIMRIPLGGMSSIFASTHSTSGKRTNASTKCQEMTHSTSNGRKTSLNYKSSNGSQHNNYFNDKCDNSYLKDKCHDVNDKFEKNEDDKVLYNNNGDLKSSKDVSTFEGNAIITMD